LQNKQEKHKYSVATQTVPNTRLSLIIEKLLQYEHYRLGLQLGRVTRLTSPHQDTHTQDSSHQDSSVITSFATSAEHPKHASTTDSSSLLYCKTSHRPTVLSPSMPPQTYDKTSPKLSQKEGHPNSVHRITSRKHKSSHVERLGSLRELAPLHLSLPQNHRVDLALLVLQIFLPWLCALVLL
jgi:hypothetical protein